MDTQSNNSSRHIVLWSGAFLLIGIAVIALFAFGRGSSSPVSVQPDTAAVVQGIGPAPEDHAQNGDRAKVMLVEYSDFQCPACGQFYPLIKKLQSELGSDLGFTYRYFPLYQIHSHALLSSYAAEAAGRQGKFWEMHDLLFERQIAWSVSDDAGKLFAAYAKELGLDQTKFDADLRSPDVAERVHKDMKSGLDAGVDATPNFYLNGKKIPELGTYEELRDYVANAIKAAQ